MIRASASSIQPVKNRSSLLWKLGAELLWTERLSFTPISLWQTDLCKWSYWPLSLDVIAYAIKRQLFAAQMIVSHGWKAHCDCYRTHWTEALESRNYFGRLLWSHVVKGVGRYAARYSCVGVQLENVSFSVRSPLSRRNPQSCHFILICSRRRASSKPYHAWSFGTTRVGCEWHCYGRTFYLTTRVVKTYKKKRAYRSENNIQEGEDVRLWKNV